MDPPQITDGSAANLVIEMSDDLSGLKSVGGRVRSPSGKALIPFEAQGASDTPSFTAVITTLTVATVEVRCIHDESVSIPPGLSGPVAGLSDAANTVPYQPHIGPPPSGSGFSLKYFEVRRYGITATSATGNTQTQIGTYKVFNKY